MSDTQSPHRRPPVDENVHPRRRVRAHDRLKNKCARKCGGAGGSQNATSKAARSTACGCVSRLVLGPIKWRRYRRSGTKPLGGPPGPRCSVSSLVVPCSPKSHQRAILSHFCSWNALGRSWSKFGEHCSCWRGVSETRGPGGHQPHRPFIPFARPVVSRMRRSSAR